jgi:hypothetical protein
MNLIELLVSLAILSFMLLGVNGMQMMALRETKSAYYFNMAISQIDVLNERLKNLKNSENININNILISWNKQNQEVLPNGKGVLRGHAPLYTIIIFWGKQTEKMSCPENRMGLSGCYALKTLKA